MLDEIYRSAKMLKEKKCEDTFLYLLPDPELRFVKVFEIQKPANYKDREEWMSIIANAYAEYYKDTETYDMSEKNICTINLVLNAIKINNIPLVRYWDVVGVEMLNVRWLRNQIN
ncbi:hypothetical protein SMD22_01005 (plasmid) [Brevibacillus halotolerans]|nr:hypothetical protein SMD22_01005 [Brevibacillus halotolerans]